MYKIQFYINHARHLNANSGNTKTMCLIRLKLRPQRHYWQCCGFSIGTFVQISHITLFKMRMKTKKTKQTLTFRVELESWKFHLKIKSSFISTGKINLKTKNAQYWNLIKESITCIYKKVSIKDSTVISKNKASRNNIFCKIQKIYSICSSWTKF